MPIERQRGPEATKEKAPSKMETYRQGIVPDSRTLDVDGYDSSTWNTGRVLKFKSYLFISSRDGRQIAGFQIIRSDAQGDVLGRLDMSKFPEITAVLREKFAPSSAPAVARAEQVRRTEQERRPEARLDGSVESVLRVLQQISVESGGNKLMVSWPSTGELARYLRTNNVPVSRYAQYIANMRDHASLLSNALRNSSFRGTVSFDGKRFTASDGSRTLITTATRVLKQENGRLMTLSGERVSVSEKASAVEYIVGDRTEIHRRDGGLAVVRQGSTTEFYDGRNDRPLMSRGPSGVRVNGPYGSVGVRPSGNPDSYAREIAMTLRTPEAIGAFISQFYYTQDYKQGQLNVEWMQQIQRSGNPVQYVHDAVDHAQDWSTTLEKGTGDCEDFALLAQELLRQAGISSFAMLVGEKHYESVYLEKAADGGYHACAVGLKGFFRSPRSYPTAGAAVASLWEGRESGAQFALKNPQVKKTFGNSYPASSPGVFTLMKSGGSTAADMVEYSDEAYFRQFVRS